jgi:DNA-binding NtrC family response regulator
MLKSYEFPGNVRELKNMTERAVILAGGNSLTGEDFPVKNKSKSARQPDNGRSTLLEQEMEMVREALQSNDYNQTAAAEQLGISRDALIRKMRKYRISIRRNENPN